MRVLSVLMGFVGAVVLLTCVLTVFLFPIDSWLLWGKVVVGSVLVLAGLLFNWSTVIKATRKRSTAFVGTSVLLSLGLVTALVALNYLAQLRPMQYDLTRERVFTLADQSTQVLASLDQDIQVTAFYTKGENDAVLLKDLFDRYHLHSARIRLEIIDPAQHPDRVAQFNMSDEGPRIIVAAAEKQVRIREVNETALTNAIMQVAHENTRRIYFLIGHGEAGIEESEETGFSATAQDLRSEGYDVMSLNLIDTGKIPDDSGLIILAGPRTALITPELTQLDAYLARGGRLLILLEPNTDPGLQQFLRTYKLGYGDGTIIDNSPYGQLFEMGPDTTIVTQYQGHPSLRALNGTMSIFVGARPIRTIDAGDGVDDSVTSQALFATGSRAWAEKNLAAGNWQQDADEAQGPLTLAAVATKNTSTVVEAQRLSPELRVLVVGDASFGDNRYRSQQINRDLLLNIIAWLCEQDNKIAIRPTHRGASRVVLSPEQKALVAFIALDALPVTLLSFGLAVWLLRRRR